MSIYSQCVLSKLLFGLETAWLTKSEQQLLDTFHIRCLRNIHGISHSWISRVSNKYVLEKLASIPLSSLLLRRQLLFYGKLARLPATSPIRKLIFRGESYEPKEIIAKKRGRPRSQWHTELHQVIQIMIPDTTQQTNALQNKDLWEQRVWHFTELSKPSD